ncbi:Nif3-like dinuclear metal center hexameric protein [Nocardioides luteus]|uniref:Nif3-like dinuclear metal center hexameric protein n=1 Tax=Nocardioides luteus TaxID=1844 RepID=UPI0018C9580B|nr:Nif3-like dinuclear metal center hexameric protein [Nocardioides luteus]MBG6095572.1 dinuclear metal center YbgI/SA1388 family protein [Nocardioides luteus]
MPIPPTPPTLAAVISLLDDWYPPATADDWDAVGLVWGEPSQPVSKVLLAVDPTLPVAEEAAAWGADLVVVHHPLFLKGVHGFAPTTPKGRTLSTLVSARCALLTAHTNADQALGGVSESLALALGLSSLRPLVPGLTPDVGTGRAGTVEPTTLGAFAESVAAALPATAAGIRVAGDLDRPVSSVALCGGAGDFLLDQVAAYDVYVTSDLRHHPASEFCEKGGALIDIPHWAAEWTWLPVLARRLREAFGDTVDTRVSEIVTDPWTLRL